MARRLSLVPPPLVTLLCGLLFGAGSCTEASPAGEPVRFDACESLMTVPADAPWTAQQATGVRTALALWNARAYTRLGSGDQALIGDPALVRLPAEPRLTIQFQSAAEPFHGFYDAPTAGIFINDGLTGSAQAIAIAHEIGHAFGLVHETARPSVMRPGNLDTEPTSGDVDALAALWGSCPRAAPPSSQ